MVEFVIVSTLERSIKSTFIIMLVLLTRKTLNVKSIKWADIILWSILFIYLLFPFSSTCIIISSSYDLPCFLAIIQAYHVPLN